MIQKRKKKLARKMPNKINGWKEEGEKYGRFPMSPKSR